MKAVVDRDRRHHHARRRTGRQAEDVVGVANRRCSRASAPAATTHHIMLRPPVQEETSVLDVDETAELTPEERLTELATILARGYLRLLRNRPDVAQPPEAGGTLLSAASERESRRRSRG